MSGLAPPGYNPEASLLAGGTGDIMKVMGGGGLPPAGYNADVSLLQGGDAVIQKVMEGGDVTFAETTEVHDVPMGANNMAARGRFTPGSELLSAAEYRSAAKVPVPPTPAPAPAPSAPPAESVPKQSSAAQFEIYEPVIDRAEEQKLQQFADSLEQKINTLPIWKKAYQDNLDAFKTEAASKWHRLNEGGSQQASVMPTKSQAMLGFDRLVEVIPTTTENIVILPPFRGDLIAFYRCIQYLLENGVLYQQNDNRDIFVKSSNVVVCLPPFFSKSNQKSMFYTGICLKNDNPNSFFILRDEDSEGVTLGNTLLEGFDAEEARGRDWLPNFLFPSYITYSKKFGRYQGLLISNQSEKGVPIAKSGLSASRVAGPVALNASLTPDPVYDLFFTILGQGVPTTPPSASLEIPACKTLETAFYDRDYTNDIYRISMGLKIHVIRLGKTKQNPLLCTDENGNPLGLFPAQGAFKGSESSASYDKGNSTVTVSIDGIYRTFRVPHDLNKVYENWENAIYSNQEAEFLNYLNLTPLLLSKIFALEGNENTWKKATADFLKNLVGSNCFEDTAILVAGRCEDTRVYLNKLVKYFFVKASTEDDLQRKLHAPETLSKDDAKKIPLPIVWPQELEALENGRDFEKDTFGEIRLVTDTEDNSLSFDMIVIHKLSDQIKFMRLNIDKDRLSKGKQSSGTVPEEYLASALKELEAQYPDFVFIY
jgi:hypothetical protein